MKHIVHIFGASGSGTSTLGRAIYKNLGFTHFDTDSYFWLPTDPPFVTPRERDERLKLLTRDVDETGNCTITGSLCGWGDPLVGRFTLAIRLVTPADERIRRIKAREQRRFGVRIEPGGDMYDEHVSFVEWAARYDTFDETQRSKALHDSWSQLLTCPLVVLDGCEPVGVLAGIVEHHINLSSRQVRRID